jgi:radical SAM superfamily enzyme YgiQ (UPF0313 family)
MKISLIKPNIGRMADGLYIDEGRMEPLQLGILAALTPDDIDIAMYDDRMENIPFDEPTDLAAITVETFTARRAYEISREYRKRGVPVILGGMHPTLIPYEATTHADSIVTGDVETVWNVIMEDAKNGCLKKFYHGENGRPQPGRMTHRDIFSNKGYLPISLIQFSRGCRFSCEYCATSTYFSGQHYHRNIDEVIYEIQNQDLKLLFFVDDNIVSDRDRAKELFRRLIPLKIKWVGQASLDMVEDLELMELMTASGCLGNVIGFESINEENLHAMNKSHNARKFDGFSSQIGILKRFGLQTWAAFTIGHEYDTVASIRETLEFALRNRFTFAAFNILMPYPGTPLYDRLKNENRLLYNGKWWLHPEYRFNHAAFIPRNMTPDELTEAAFQARRKFNSPVSILKRSLDLKTNLRTAYRLLTFMRYAPLFRKEVHKKQGMYLGKTQKNGEF